jgi:hypothetical protein
MDFQIEQSGWILNCRTLHLLQSPDCRPGPGDRKSTFTWQEVIYHPFKIQFAIKKVIGTLPSNGTLFKYLNLISQTYTKIVKYLGTSRHLNISHSIKRREQQNIITAVCTVQHGY